jgi:hypothetical protein
MEVWKLVNFSIKLWCLKDDNIHYLSWRKRLWREAWCDVVYLETRSVAGGYTPCSVGRLASNGPQRMWMEELWPALRYYPAIGIDLLWKATKCISQGRLVYLRLSKPSESCNAPHPVYACLLWKVCRVSCQMEDDYGLKDWMTMIWATPAICGAK